jgi:hypothetical protein
MATFFDTGKNHSGYPNLFGLLNFFDSIIFYMCQLNRSNATQIDAFIELGFISLILFSGSLISFFFTIVLWPRYSHPFDFKKVTRRSTAWGSLQLEMETSITSTIKLLDLSIKSFVKESAPDDIKTASDLRTQVNAAFAKMKHLFEVS